MKTISRSLAIIAPAVLLFGIVTPANAADTPGQYGYDQPGDKNYVTNTDVLERFSPDGGNNQSYKVVADRAQADAAFATQAPTVDGVKDASWNDAQSYPIEHKFNAGMTGDDPSATTTGTVRLMWDGPVLYGLVQVSGDSTESDSATPNWNTPSYAANTDGIYVSMDVYNDQWGLETDTQGTFFLSANPNLTSVTSYNNPTIPSLGSFFNPTNQDYSTRLKAFKSSGYTPGDGVNYTYEFALQIEGWGDEPNRQLTDGTKVGLEVGAYDQGNSFTYWSKSQYYTGLEDGSNLPDAQRTPNRDWGVVTLDGWDKKTPFAYSGWSADEDIRFWNSKSNPGGSGNGTQPGANGDGSAVWTPASKNAFVSAKNAYLAIKDSATASRADKEAAVTAVTDAFDGLRWADTKYPDPHDLPQLQTLPSAYTFFDPTKGTNGQVTNAAQWQKRKKEILDLAQFYEYGYKPQLGVDYTINVTGNAYNGTGNPVVTAQVVPTNANFAGGVPVNISIPITLPASVPGGGEAAVGFSTNFTANGIANVTFPNWGGDNRTDAGAWGNPNRVGTFYTLFPYQRNSTSADSSILIANATAVSVYLDALQAAVAANAALAAKIDPATAVTKGFSINGKEAFVAAVFDDRVKAVVAGGAGATGPANWRYNAQGQEFDFSGTAYDNPGAQNIVSHGTEGPGNSYRHNRVRETELFRHFLPYGHEYDHQDGSYGYGDYSRLPFDQADLVATLAPDRAIIIDTNLNDYNDGAVTDNMSLEIAKSVYDNMGVNGSDFVKFNSGNYVSSGDPHGAASATPEGHYLSDLLYGTKTLTAEESARLNTDPYSLKVSDGQTQNPYDYYWGGYNTITGGKTGVGGGDGWYFSGFASELADLRSTVAGLGLNQGRATALTVKLDHVKKLQASDQPSEAAVVLGDFITQVAGFGQAGIVSSPEAGRIVSSAQQLVLFLNAAGAPQS
ncbi:sugar-binding protein [Microbacterium rhizosphaerae]|uniref:Sugar-binding protein n=1 Tax=Microbacterium rhizosphaerae TaxID=1678237 RepID=A0ABZ0SME6_9MICO|nr:sugar-binding protein [Microbacterium rhizosphaerae]WPR89421.1 sugar-binding protein [Microbacterium rhizosphaerae]